MLGVPTAIAQPRAATVRACTALDVEGTQLSDSRDDVCGRVFSVLLVKKWKKGKKVEKTTCDADENPRQPGKQRCEKGKLVA